ncbi:hypothetical protein C8R31_10480 [Nitrosospira sp. Nsp2]|nr:hypothetical protein C8R31_10480 [Nitrosospira sp. Nsp2]
MCTDVVLQWSFSPSNYFKKGFNASCDGHTLKIAPGKVEALIDAETYESNPSLRGKLHSCLNIIFLAQHFSTHTAYKLSQPTKVVVHQNGRKDYFVELEPAIIRITGGSVDFQVTDKNGNVISDSAAKSLQIMEQLRQGALAHASDELLLRLLQSYDAAVNDPNNELVHLYEIRDALAHKFGTEANARSTLAIPNSIWSRLGRICNNEPLNQGRHRGQNARTVLRDAGADELAEARGIVRNMIEAYLRYLPSR